MTRVAIALTALALELATSAHAQAPQQTSLAEARAIAKEAYIYGLPMVDNYRIQHTYFVDRGNPEYKGGWNTVHNVDRVYTPDDKAIQTPNSDTPYSHLGADLRAEPLVISVPDVDKDRYYSAQFIDMYTFNFNYVGTRASANDAGNFLLAGPHWKGGRPVGIERIIRSETELDYVLFRTQLFDARDIDNVRKIQGGYKVQPLSQFLGEPAPPSPPPIKFRNPLTAEQARTSPEFFDLLNWLLQFCPTHPSETALMERFAKLNIGAGRKFDVAALSSDMRKAVEAGIADAWAAFDAHKVNELDTGRKSSADAFGTRASLRNNYLERMSGAVLGIYGNSKEEAIYPAYFTDAEGRKLNGDHRYTLRFAPGQLPPARAFWSLTMYEMPASLLYANPLNRYLINSSMLADLKRDPDGAITLYIQHEAPGMEMESNWLPAPRGDFLPVLRIYWPRPEALNGTWKQPPLQRLDAGDNFPAMVERLLRTNPLTGLSEGRAVKE